MFQPHDDRRHELADGSRARSRIVAVLGFVLGFGIGWLAWDRVALPLLRSTPTADNPSGDPADWLYYGSLIACVGITLFVVAVIGEFLGSRRRPRANNP